LNRPPCGSTAPLRARPRGTLCVGSCLLYSCSGRVFDGRLGEMKRILCFAFLVAVLTGEPRVHAQTSVPARALAIVDTSSSMLQQFGNCSSGTGDGATTAAYCDNALTGSTFTCAAHATCSASVGLPLFPSSTTGPSRMFAAKAALNQFLSTANGSIDLGL